MPKVTFTLKDVDGAVEANVVYSGDFDLESNAHQVALAVTAYLDTIMKREDGGLNDLQKNLGTFPAPQTLESQMLFVDR